MRYPVFQRFDGPQMIYSGKLRHQLRRKDFHLANFAARFGFLHRDLCNRELHLRYLQAHLQHLRPANDIQVIQDN